MAPSSIMLCKTPRETCGSCDFRKTSRRSNGSDCSTVIESERSPMGRRWNGRWRAPALRTMRKPEPERPADSKYDDTGGLARRKAALRNIVIATERFRERAQNRVANQVNRKNLPIKFFVSITKHQRAVERKIERGFVKLHRMNPGSVRCVIERKMHRPRDRTRTAIAATRHKTTNSSKRMAKRHTRRHHVRDFPERQIILPAINNRPERGADQSAIKNQPV